MLKCRHILQCPACTSIRIHAIRPIDRPRVYINCAMVCCEDCSFNAWVPVPSYIPNKQVEKYLIKQWYDHPAWDFVWNIR